MFKIPLNSLIKGQSFIERVLTYITFGIILIMVFLTTADVILRYIFNSPLPGVVELEVILLVALIYLGIPYVQSIRGHIRLDLIASHLRPVAETTMTVFGHVICFIIFGVIAWESGLHAFKSTLIGEFAEGLINYPLWPAKWAVSIGCAFFALRCLIDIIVDVRNIRNLSSE